MIKSFKCRDFRNVTCDMLNFERVNILIGPNNAGKSNFIRALSFVANMVNSPIEDTTGFFSELKRNGWDSVANKRDNASGFHCAWEFQLAEGFPVAYKLSAHVGAERASNYITAESLDRVVPRAGADKPYNFFNCHIEEIGIGSFSSAGMRSVPNSRLRAVVNPQESVLLQMDNLFFKNMNLFSNTFVRDEVRNVLELMKMYFKSFYSYSCASFNLAAIREMQDVQNDGRHLSKDGSNFVNFCFLAKEEDSSFEERYRSILCQLIAGCEDFRICRAGGKLWIELIIDGCSFSMSELSDGTVHLLVLLCLLCAPKDRGISMLAIDEPEMNLHPAWQKLVAAEIQRCFGFKQCFISTHSPDFLDEFTQGFLDGEVGVFVFDPASVVPIRKLDREVLRTELTDWTLGDLYRVGDPVVGGWPQ